MKKILITSILILISFNLKAQVGFSYLHSDVISAVGISTNPDKNIWGELRMGMDINAADFSPEIVGFTNVIKRDDFKMFLGVGGRLQVLEGIVLPAIGFTFKPIESKPNFALHAEGALIVGDFGEVLRGSFGFRYFLRKKSK